MKIQNFKNNNILNSIFYAEKIIKRDIIISYSDILFESSVVKRLLQSDHDISVVVDIDWRGYYVGAKIILSARQKMLILTQIIKLKKLVKLTLVVRKCMANLLV